MICSIILPPVFNADVITEKSMPVASTDSSFFRFRGNDMLMISLKKSSSKFHITSVTSYTVNVTLVVKNKQTFIALCTFVAKPKAGIDRRTALQEALNESSF